MTRGRYDENVLQAAAKLQRTVAMAASGAGATHPWPVLRVKRILDWGNSDQYHDILGGDYMRDTASPVSLPFGTGSPKCSQCGNFMPAGSTYCSYCGQRL